MDIKQLEEAVLRCNKCGFCQATCPTYKELGEEAACARGRIRLIQEVFCRLTESGEFEKAVESIVEGKTDPYTASDDLVLPKLGPSN